MNIINIKEVKAIKQYESFYASYNTGSRQISEMQEERQHEGIVSWQENTSPQRYIPPRKIRVVE